MRTDKRGLQVSTLALGLLALGTGQSHAVPLSDLLAGGSITCLDKTFTNFHAFASTAHDGGHVIAPNEINIIPDPHTCAPGQSPTASPGPGILIQSDSFNVNALQGQDTTFSYDVTSSGGFRIHDADLFMEAFDTTGDGDIHIIESLFNGTTNIGNLSTDAVLGITDEHAGFDPLTLVSVIKDISLEGHGGSAVLSSLRQDFSQTVPEPASLGIIGFGLAGLGLLRRRRGA